VGDWCSEWISRILGNGWKYKQGNYQLESVLLSINGINKDIEFKNVRCKEKSWIYMHRCTKGAWQGMKYIKCW